MEPGLPARQLTTQRARSLLVGVLATIAVISGTAGCRQATDKEQFRIAVTANEISLQSTAVCSFQELEQLLAK